MFNQAVIGYSVLHLLATRFRDSDSIADESTSLHLARQHTQNYVQAIQQISRLLHDVVVWELDREGLECLCLCPGCSVGICLGAMSARTFLSNTWVEAGPIADDEGIYVQLPKQNSAAAKAGLRRGDVILAAGGQEFESWGDIQRAVQGAEPGEEIRLTVRRDSDVLEEVVIVRP
jgi:membrane-associated protease RseP (regulator of RpoE activity)